MFTLKETLEKYIIDEYQLKPERYKKLWAMVNILSKTAKSQFFLI